MSFHVSLGFPGQVRDATDRKNTSTCVFTGTRMQCFLWAVPFSPLSNNPSPTLCVANKLLASDSPRKNNRLTHYSCMYFHLTCVETDECHRQGYCHGEQNTFDNCFELVCFDNLPDLISNITKSYQCSS